MRSSPVLVAAAVLAAACASSPPVSYFALPEPASGRTVPAAVTAAPVVVIGPFLLPEYLDRAQLVTREAGQRLRIDDFNRWAEPVDAAFGRLVAAHVDGLLADARAVQHPAGSLAAGAPRVTGRLLRFDAQAGGRAVLDVQWAVTGADGVPILAPRRSRFETTVAGPYPDGVVAALAAAAREFAGEVAAALERGVAVRAD